MFNSIGATTVHLLERLLNTLDLREYEGDIKIYPPITLPETNIASKNDGFPSSESPKLQFSPIFRAGKYNVINLCRSPTTNLCFEVTGPSPAELPSGNLT